MQINAGGTTQDHLVYPIVFLYRQYIELFLKNLINKGNAIRDLKMDRPNHHKIDLLWLTLKKLLDNKIHKEYDLVEHVISELAEADPASLNFRYPTDKNGNNSSSGISNIINLRYLCLMINQCHEKLDRLHTGWDGLINMKADI